MVRKLCEIHGFYSELSDSELTHFENSLYIIISVILIAGAIAYRVHMGIVLEDKD